MNEENLKKLFNATVKPVTNVLWNDNIMKRYYSLEGKRAFVQYNNNVNKLVSKIPKLQTLKTVLEIKKKNRTNNSVKWVEEWFSRNTFSETSILHSIPEGLKDVTKISHNISLLYTINNKNVVLHGSFLTHLLNPLIKYSDIDLTCLHDELIFITSFLLYVFLGFESHIISIPYIINHRQLRANGDNTSICDALKLDVVTLFAYQVHQVSFGKDLYINVQNPVVQFFNFFKMLHLPERRMKLRHYKENQKLMLTTIVSTTMKYLGIKHHMLDKELTLGFKYSVKIEEDNVIHLYLEINNIKKNIYFYNQLRDKDFMPVLDEILPKGTNYMAYTQMGSVYPEQRVDIIRDNSIGDEVHINLSRNDVFKVLGESNEIATVSLLNLLAVYGLHTFFTRTYEENTVEIFTRVIMTIINVCKVMYDEPITHLYQRVKNDGDHIVRRINNNNIHIPSVNNHYFSFQSSIQEEYYITYDLQQYLEYIETLNASKRMI